VSVPARPSPRPVACFAFGYGCFGGQAAEFTTNHWFCHVSAAAHAGTPASQIQTGIKVRGRLRAVVLSLRSFFFESRKQIQRRLTPSVCLNRFPSVTNCNGVTFFDTLLGRQAARAVAGRYGSQSVRFRRVANVGDRKNDLRYPTMQPSQQEVSRDGSFVLPAGRRKPRQFRRAAGRRSGRRKVSDPAVVRSSGGWAAGSSVRGCRSGPFRFAASAGSPARSIHRRLCSPAAPLPAPLSSWPERRPRPSTFPSSARSSHRCGRRLSDRRWSSEEKSPSLSSRMR